MVAVKPRDDGFRLPARFVEHQRTLMSWPCNSALFGALMRQGREEWAEVARGISHFEPVTMLVPPGDVDEAGELLGPGVEIMTAALDDSWIRDNGPIFLRDDKGRVAPLGFQFDAWGGSFPGSTCEDDAAVPALVASTWGTRLYEAPFVLEGGAFNTDGEGTIVTTEQCLLHYRNLGRGMSRGDYERELSDWLGIEKVIWLPFGILEDTGPLSTAGHADDVVQFLAPGVVLAQSCDPSNWNYSRLQENLEVLHAATDARGRSLEVVELEQLPYIKGVGKGVPNRGAPGAFKDMPAPYVNMVFANGAVFLPRLGVEGEEEAYELIGGLLPGRELVGLPTEMSAFGGGGLGCITQQVPAGELLARD